MGRSKQADKLLLRPVSLDDFNSQSVNNSFGKPVKKIDLSIFRYGDLYFLKYDFRGKFRPK